MSVTYGHGGCAASSQRQRHTMHGGQESGAGVNYATPLPPSSLTKSASELEDRYRLPVCDGRHNRRRQTTTTTTTTRQTTTTDNGRRRARVDPRQKPAERSCGVSWRRWWRKGQDVVVVEDGGFVRRSFCVCHSKENDDDDVTDNSNFERRTHKQEEMTKSLSKTRHFSSLREKEKRVFFYLFVKIFCFSDLRKNKSGKCVCF